MNVFVLNSDYSYIGTIDWQRSIVLLYQGKAEIIKETERIIYNTDKSVSFIIPRVVRLIKQVKDIFKNKIGYSKYNVFLRDKFSCQYCGIKLAPNECTVDHVIPKALDGKTKWTNVVCACKKCNNMKGDKLLSELKMKLRKEPEAPSVSDFLRMKSNQFNLWINEL